MSKSGSSMHQIFIQQQLHIGMVIPNECRCLWWVFMSHQTMNIQYTNQTKLLLAVLTCCSSFVCFSTSTHNHKPRNKFLLSKQVHRVTHRGTWLAKKNQENKSKDTATCCSRKVFILQTTNSHDSHYKQLVYGVQLE